MRKKSLLAPLKLRSIKDLNSLVENKKSYTYNNCELDIYETHTATQNVSLKFSNFAFTGMIRGKKELRIANKTDKFEYLPGESLVMLPGEEMIIDFPEADTHPSQCIALSIDNSFIKSTVDYLNGNFPKIDTDSEWKFSDECFFLFNSPSLSAATNNILRIAIENNSAKDYMTDLALKELLIRIMQTQARKYFETNFLKDKSVNRFAAIVDYIRNNLREKISMEGLAKQAYMSKSNFFRAFKQEFGISPNNFILQERIGQAKSLLRHQLPVTEAAYQTGFSDANYFIKAFKDVEGVTPKHYQRELLLKKN